MPNVKFAMTYTRARVTVTVGKNGDDFVIYDEFLFPDSSHFVELADIDRLIEFAKRAGGIDYAYETMERLRDEANDVLSPFSPDETVDQLREIFDYVIARKL